MQTRVMICAVIVAIVASWAVAQQRSSTPGQTGRQDAKRQRPAAHAVFWTKDQGEWSDVPVFPAGAKMKVINGDPGKGPSDLYIKVPPKYDTTFHWHTPVESVYVDAGTLEFRMPKTTEKRSIGAGGFFQSPSRMVHRAVCTSSEDCYFFLHSAGVFDIHLVDENGRPVSAKNK